MCKKFIIAAFVLSLVSCAEVMQVMEDASHSQNYRSLTEHEISMGLKEALNKGISEQVTNLAKPNGFLKDQMARILLPKELETVENTLRDIGMGNLADEGIKLLNRAAEDAVGEAIPIFKNAIVNMSFRDASSILMGANDAATLYLKRTTEQSLKNKFEPIISNSFQKVGADVAWNKMITAYNRIPLVKDVNPNLIDYTTEQALESVFKKVALEELTIRTNVSSRTTDLLKKVFAKQDRLNF